MPGGYVNLDIKDAGPVTRTVRVWSSTGAITGVLSAAPPGEGEVRLGEVGGRCKTVNQAPTVSTTQYTSGDVIGAKMTFANVARVAAGSGFVQEVTINSKSAQTGAVDLILFKADPSSSTFTDNAALAVAAGDFSKVLAVIHISDWTNLGTPSVAQALNLAIPFELASGQDIYGVLVARSAPTLASTSDLSIDLRAVQN